MAALRLLNTAFSPGDGSNGAVSYRNVRGNAYSDLSLRGFFRRICGLEAVRGWSGGSNVSGPPRAFPHHIMRLKAPLPERRILGVSLVLHPELLS